MRVTVFSTKSYDRRFLDLANAAAGGRHQVRYIEARLTEDSAALANGAEAVCAFVNDVLLPHESVSHVKTAIVLDTLKETTALPL